MQVRAPIDGVVLERLSAPGVVLSPERERHAVCTLFDPSSLRVRVDVPQAEIALIFPGQRAEVLAESRRGEAYAGEVLRIVRQANLSKVTLEVQVRLFEPDGLLRPEMLAQVRFFGRPLAEPDAGASAAGGAHSVLVPERLLEGGRLWVLAPDGLAQRREVELGALHGDRIEVLSGINLSDKLIDRGREDLREGDRVHVGGQR